MFDEAAIHALGAKAKRSRRVRHGLKVNRWRWFDWARRSHELRASWHRPKICIYGWAGLRWAGRLSWAGWTGP